MDDEGEEEEERVERSTIAKTHHGQNVRTRGQ